MPDFRSDIRRAIFTKVCDNSLDIMQDAIGITKILGEFSKRYKDFDQLEKLNIEVTIPIRLPPDGKKGDCKAVVDEVKKSLNELGGGTTTHHGEGSWLDGEKNVVSDDCVVVFTAMPIGKWFQCIPVLQRLIRDEIQSKLFQECVFLRIDNQTFGNPINLLGEQTTDDFPSIDEFGKIDPGCLTIMKEYEEPQIQTAINQEINGDGNTLIQSGGDTIAAIGEGAMAAQGNIHVHKHGIDPKEHAILMAELMAENLRLEEKITQMNEETDEERRKQIALEATKIAEKLQKNKTIEFDAWKLIEIGNAAKLAGNLELGEGYYKQALRKFNSDEDRYGEAASLNNLGNIAETRGDLAEAERLYRESLTIQREVGDRQGEATSLNNLGNIAETRGQGVEAKDLFREANKIRREIGLPVREEE